MSSDALESLQQFVRVHGRQPTLSELYRFMGNDPAGLPVNPNPTIEGPAPSQREDEHGDGPLTTQLRFREILRAEPRLLKVREQIMNRLLFGEDAGETERELLALLGGTPQRADNPLFALRPSGAAASTPTQPVFRTVGI